MVSLQSIKEYGHKKLYGENSLTLGELVALIVAFLVWKFRPLGKWSTYGAIAIVVLALVIW